MPGKNIVTAAAMLAFLSWPLHAEPMDDPAAPATAAPTSSADTNATVGATQTVIVPFDQQLGSTPAGDATAPAAAHDAPAVREVVESVAPSPAQVATPEAPTAPQPQSPAAAALNATTPAQGMLPTVATTPSVVMPPSKETQVAPVTKTPSSTLPAQAVVKTAPAKKIVAQHQPNLPKGATKKALAKDESNKKLTKTATKHAKTADKKLANKNSKAPTVKVAAAPAPKTLPQITRHTVAASATQPLANSILEVTQSAGNFKTLTKLLRLAGFKPMLETRGSYTLFAPNDTAFMHFSSAQLANLEQPENREELIEILSNHLIGGHRISDTTMQNASASPATMAGQALTFVHTNGRVQVNGVDVVGKAIPCSNGIIHVVNQILLPVPIIATTPAAETPAKNPDLTTAKNTVKIESPIASPNAAGNTVAQ